MRALLAFLVLLASQIYASINNYVTICTVNGQLGSQLFAVAMTLGYGWENNLTPVFSKNIFLSAPGGRENYLNIFFRLPEKFPENMCEDPPTHVNYADLSPFPLIKGNVCLCGLRTEFWYFNRYRTEIRELFQPSQAIKKKLERKYSTIINHPKTVAVHIRTYHPIKCPYHLFLGKEYYINAIKSFPEDHLFIIFSDRIGWCRENLQQLNRQIVFIDSNDHLLDFYLMASCKNIITANSTYSWWAAYLKKNEEGLILVPERWFTHDFNTPLNDALTRKFYPSDWIVLPVENDSFCYDVLDHDTTSLDEKEISSKIHFDKICNFRNEKGF